MNLESILTILVFLTFASVTVGLLFFFVVKTLGLCKPKETEVVVPEVVEPTTDVAEPTTKVVELAHVLKVYGKFDIWEKLNKVLEEARDCPIRSWDIWEIGQDKDALSEFQEGTRNLQLRNHRIAYCKSKDELCSKLMDVSLTHDIVAFNLTKNYGHTWSILGIGVIKTQNIESNIDADIVESISGSVEHELSGDEIHNANIDEQVSLLAQRLGRICP